MFTVCNCILFLPLPAPRNRAIAIAAFADVPDCPKFDDCGRPQNRAIAAM